MRRVVRLAAVQVLNQIALVCAVFVSGQRPATVIVVRLAGHRLCGDLFGSNVQLHFQSFKKMAVWPGCVIDADAMQAMAVVFIVQTVQDDQGQTLNAAQIRFQRPMQQALNHSQRHCHQLPPNHQRT